MRLCPVPTPKIGCRQIVGPDSVQELYDLGRLGAKVRVPILFAKGSARGDDGPGKGKPPMLGERAVHALGRRLAHPVHLRRVQVAPG